MPGLDGNFWNRATAKFGLANRNSGLTNRKKPEVRLCLTLKFERVEKPLVGHYLRARLL